MTVFDSLVDKISRFAITCTYAFTCFFIFGQPKAPDGMEKYKKYKNAVDN